MHVLSISKNPVGKIAVEGSEYSSLESPPIEPDQESSIVLLPSFPINWPSLLKPTTMDDFTKSETRTACSRLAQCTAVRNYYTQFWDGFYNATEAHDLDSKVVHWLKDQTNIHRLSVVEQVCFTQFTCFLSNTF